MSFISSINLVDEFMIRVKAAEPRKQFELELQKLCYFLIHLYVMAWKAQQVQPKNSIAHSYL